ncbi:MAG: YkvA family protein [bacterium]
MSEESDESSIGTDVGQESQNTGSAGQGTGGEGVGMNDQQTGGGQSPGSGPSGPGVGQSSPPGGGADGKLRQLLRKQFALQMENVIPEDVQRILDQLEDRLETLKQSREVELADKAYGRVRLMGRMLQASAEGSFPLPWKSAAAITVTLTYLINPFDILPDILKGDGILDDSLVLYLGYTVVEQDMVEFLRTHDLDASEFGVESTQTLL